MVRAEVKGRTLPRLAFWGIPLAMGTSIGDTPKVKRGRPSTGGRRQGVMVRFEPTELDHLDAWIAKQNLPPSRPEAVRRILREALNG